MTGVQTCALPIFALILDQTFKVGDVIKVGEDMGVVHQIGLRTTRIKSLDTSNEAVWDRDNQLWDATGSDAKDNWGSGDFTGSPAVVRVVSPGNVFNEHFLDDAFQDNVSADVTWDKEGELVFS